LLWIRLIITLFLASFVNACAVGQDTKAAEAVVAEFREHMASAALGDIYDAAADDWKKAMSRDDTRAFLGAVNRKLGAVKTSKQTGWRDDVTTNGHLVTLEYHTEFEHGDGDEAFVVRLKNAHGQLAGYHINSMAMMVN